MAIMGKHQMTVKRKIEFRRKLESKQNKEIKEEEKPISQEEREARIKSLKELGLLKS